MKKLLLLFGAFAMVSTLAAQPMLSPDIYSYSVTPTSTFDNYYCYSNGANITFTFTGQTNITLNVPPLGWIRDMISGNLVYDSSWFSYSISGNKLYCTIDSGPADGNTLRTLEFHVGQSHLLINQNPYYRP